MANRGMRKGQLMLWMHQNTDLPQYMQGAEVAAEALLNRYGAKAIQYNKIQGRWVKLLDDSLIAKLRWGYLSSGREWPYEHIWPGVPDRFMVAYRRMEARLRHISKKQYEKDDLFRQERIAQIKHNMKHMDEWIFDYQSDLKIQHGKIPLQDRLLLSDNDLYKKYVISGKQKQTKFKEGKL